MCSLSRLFDPHALSCLPILSMKACTLDLLVSTPPDSLRYQSFLAEGPEQEIIYPFEHQMTVILVEGELTSQMCVKYGGKHIDASPL